MLKKLAQLRNMRNKFVQIRFRPKIQKNILWRTETQTARQSKRVIFRKKKEEQLSKVGQEKWSRICQKIIINISIIMYPADKLQEEPQWTINSSHFNRKLQL